MENPLISVIVPIYNLGESIKITVDSLLSQVYKNIEIVLVDDGSIDNSLEICKAYEKKDKRVKVYHHKNKGASFTRNMGINKSHGDYVSFIDGGDEVNPNLYSTLVNYISDDVELIEYKHNVLTERGLFDTPKYKLEKNNLINKRYIDDIILPRLLNLVSNDDYLPVCFVWKFLFKTSIINEHKIRFNENLKKWEDREFIIDYLDKCNNVRFLDNVLITYDCRDSLPHLSREFFDLTLHLISLFKEREKKFAYKYQFDTQYYFDYTAVVIVNNLIELHTNAHDKLEEKLIFITNDNWTINVFANWKPKDKQNKKIKKSILSRDIELCMSTIRKIDDKKSRQKSVLGHLIRNKILVRINKLLVSRK